MVKWPNPNPPPDTVELTVRWDRVVIDDVEWLVISRDGIILGAVREPGGTASNAWLNDGSNGGIGQFGTWS
ncbi:MAG: hypothetical protein KF830_17975 [Planctomycetes bacterium]|nr:hypothetical protein [Planctomycetota bacterium]